MSVVAGKGRVIVSSARAAADAVLSVFGRVGAVTAQLGDYTSSLITNASTVAGVTVTGALDTLKTSIAAKASQALTINALSGASHTVALSWIDAETEISHGSACTVVVPTNAQLAVPIGSVFPIMQTGAGLLTVAPFDGTVTVNTSSTLVSAGQWAQLTLIKRGTNLWVLTGERGP